MSVAGAASDCAVRFASAARLLAGWWSRPTADERERWTASWSQGIEVAHRLEVAPDSVVELQSAVEAAQPDLLLEEYERLLIGPGRAPCPPYESLWRSDQPRREQGRLMGAAAADVARIYRDLGLRVRQGAHELPDHLAIEWEALAYAFEREALDASEKLVRAHLAIWMEPFCAAVVASDHTT